MSNKRSKLVQEMRSYLREKSFVEESKKPQDTMAQILNLVPKDEIANPVFDWMDGDFEAERTERIAEDIISNAMDSEHFDEDIDSRFVDVLERVLSDIITDELARAAENVAKRLTSKDILRHKNLR